MRISDWNILSRFPGNLKTPAIISSVPVLPFIVLELINRRSLPGGFHFMLIILLWLLPLSFMLILLSILRDPQAGKRRMASSLNLLTRVACLIFLAWFWVGLILDQMPCFLGVPNCD